MEQPEGYHKGGPNMVLKLIKALYGLKQAADVKIDLYDMSGRLLNHLYSGNDGAGSYIRNVDVSNLTDGTYLVSTTAGAGLPVVSKLVVSH